MKQKTTYKLTFFFCAPPAFLLAVFFVYIFAAKASSDELIISEIMYDPKNTDSGHSDWIEIYNASDHDITFSKSNFGLIDEKEDRDSTTGKLKNTCHTIADSSVIIKSGEFMIIADNKNDFEKDYHDCPVKVLDTVLDLSTGGDTIKLSLNRCSSWAAELAYESSWGGKNNGKTLELMDFDEGYEKKNWQQSWQMFGTPGAPKSEKKKYDQKIYINEICPKPADGEKEFVELYNAKNKEEKLDEWKIVDRAGKECLLDGKEIDADDYLILFNNPDENCAIGLNDSGGEELHLLDPNGEVISKIDSYTTAKLGLAYALDGNKWRWTKFLTPGKENIFNNIPKEKKTLIPDKAYVNVYAEFYVKVSDKDGDKTKVTWNFGDGHKSYKNETRHKYQKEGKYNGSFKISDGSEDVVKEFMVEVEDYPERKVRIVAINANPVGKDTEGESITIANKSKKKINLNGWSVATGANSKKLSNHPIKEDLEIKAGKTGEITRDICALTLNNSKGMVELRYPDGSAAHAVKYKKQDKESIKEGEVYEKKGEKWIWTQIAKVKSEKLKVKSDSEEDEESDLQSEISNSDDDNSNAGGILPEEVGKKSEMEIENKLDENPYLENTSLPSRPAVLGVATVRAAESSYQFTPEAAPEEHYVISFLRKACLFINSSVNKAANYFL